MTLIKFTSDNVQCSFGEWRAQLSQEQIEVITETIDTETLIAELESRGYSVRKED